MALHSRRSLLNRIQRHDTIILHYNHQSRDLRPWFWPVNASGARVAPSDLSLFRIRHDFRGPCCLCACDAIGRDYTESAVYLLTRGYHSGSYVAGCATDSCGYLIDLERLFTKGGLLLKRYPLRAAEVPAPPPIVRRPRRRPAGRLPLAALQTGQFGPGEELVAILQYHRPSESTDPKTAMDQLLRLDSSIRPGLTAVEFKRLFAKCRCGLIMTRRVIEDHECARIITVQPQGAVIDLTTTSDEQ